MDPYPFQQPNEVFAGAAGVERQLSLERDRREYFRRHLQRLEEHLRVLGGPRRLWEIGCGSGVLLGEARERGWQVEAVELSVELAAAARCANPQALIRVGDVLDTEPGESRYDGVLALDVLEHVLDPSALLDICFRSLKPGGVLLVQTPNTRSLRARLQGTSWPMRDPEQHLNLFSPGGLRLALTRAGFQLVTMTTVSGSGRERGLGRSVAALKARALAWGELGNALLVVAHR